MNKYRTYILNASKNATCTILLYPEFNALLSFLSNKKHASMVPISSEYHYGTDKAVQISGVVFFL